ncbi:SPOR domain-containing protein [Streptomyces gobiensis]|uniref:SPOR domain-containing protein n=1 Tax=Streptomyces gobiensis TaxID=2875706 RepID=UPI001E29EBC3|nr:SPOR domain-containing protein [Streptomyces gobiensis]UGY93446.1 SPOR domain-containing protein [Streptomyces gobiensis]
MNENATLPWMVIRQDDNGSRYRVGRYATRGEAQTLVDRLGKRVRRDAEGGVRRYVVERLGHTSGDQG